MTWWHLLKNNQNFGFNHEILLATSTLLYLPPLLTDWLGFCSCTSPHSKDQTGFSVNYVLYRPELGWVLSYTSTTTSISRENHLEASTCSKLWHGGRDLISSGFVFMEKTNKFKVNGLNWHECSDVNEVWMSHKCICKTWEIHNKNTRQPIDARCGLLLRSRSLINHHHWLYQNCSPILCISAI